MSLKKQLTNLIKSRGEITYFELKDMLEAGAFGKVFKTSTMQRKLRESESPMIESLYKKGCVVGYKFKEIEEIPMFAGTQEALSKITIIK